MHRCLLVAEIVRLIVEEVHQDYDGFETLAILARTCRVFHDPALNMLWH